MISETNTVVRAFEIARSGSCRTLDDIRQQLKREGCANCEAHLSGASIKKQLVGLLNKNPTASN